ncbi:FtsQ-type POTRA domain-containing protein [Nakamurella flavida]|uniref:FtsQ-type POTRA domain-containing protein n=1 Tax=Nakamurella flavida TaxID=363630 RepID=A0A938YMQ0_9ACTN|nr:FtsQ-type POTRA domain-containing protein [Nakamurella flavida]MBM9477528.1 FtsQ-type POTRA domain-containing protein [Nakamurella flavida]MDP9777461.1 cell division protein FtsQ [Nakamurella flavida]
MTDTADDASQDPDPDRIDRTATPLADRADGADHPDVDDDTGAAASRGGEQVDQAPPTRPRRVVRPPRRWPWIVGMVLAVVVLIGGFVTVWWTPLLGLRTVQVSGVQDDVRAQVQAAVDVTAGTPLARIDLDAVSARVADVPSVASVQVSRGWPHALDVQVVARVPVAVTQANGSWWLMDAAGDPYVPVDAAPAGLPVVELATPGAGDPATVAALTVAQALPDGLRTQVAAVAARTAFDVTLRLADGRTVVWGDAADATQTARKIEVLPALLQQDGTVLDVSDPTLVTVR